MREEVEASLKALFYLSFYLSLLKPRNKYFLIQIFFHIFDDEDEGCRDYIAFK